MDIHSSIPFSIRNSPLVSPEKLPIPRSRIANTTAQHGYAGRSVLPIEWFIESTSHNKCNHIKHLGVPTPIAVLYIPSNTSSPISVFEQKMSADIPDNTFDSEYLYPSVEILDESTVEYPSENWKQRTPRGTSSGVSYRERNMQPIRDDVYDDFIYKVLHSQIKEPDEEYYTEHQKKPKKRSKKRAKQ